VKAAAIAREVPWQAWAALGAAVAVYMAWRSASNAVSGVLGGAADAAAAVADSVRYAVNPTQSEARAALIGAGMLSPTPAGVFTSSMGAVNFDRHALDLIRNAMKPAADQLPPFDPGQGDGWGG
jgi:hypothetical protein